MDDFEVKVDSISNQEVLDYLGEVSYWAGIEEEKDLNDDYGNNANEQLKMMSKIGWNIQYKARNLSKCFKEIKETNEPIQIATINKSINKLANEIDPFLGEYLGFVDSFPIFRAMIVKVEDYFEEDSVSDSMGIEVVTYSENLMDYCEKYDSSSQEKPREEYLDDFIELSDQVSSCGKLISSFSNMIHQQHTENIIARERIKK